MAAWRAAGGSVLSVSSRALLDACARLGLDTGQILQAARLDPVTLQDPDARIPLEQDAALWRKAYELSNDPNLALHAIEVLPFGAYRVIDFLASSAPTARRWPKSRTISRSSTAWSACRTRWATVSVIRNHTADHDL